MRCFRIRDNFPAAWKRLQPQSICRTWLERTGRLSIIVDPPSGETSGDLTRPARERLMKLQTIGKTAQKYIVTAMFSISQSTATLHPQLLLHIICFTLAGIPHT